MMSKNNFVPILEEFDLNRTQFYQAWSTGTLSTKALEIYANEYGNFIGQLSDGWKTLGNEYQAQIENNHYDLWKNDFCRALNVEISEITLPAVKDLMITAKDMFSKKISALGSLYIFIAQQASTSKSKLEGMRKYYQLPTYSESYFQEHLESDILAKKLMILIEELPAEDQKKVIEAAHIFAKKLFQALENIYDKYPSRISL